MIPFSCLVPLNWMSSKLPAHLIFLAKVSSTRLFPPSLIEHQSPCQSNLRDSVCEMDGRMSSRFSLTSHHTALCIILRHGEFESTFLPSPPIYPTPARSQRDEQEIDKTFITHTNRICDKEHTEDSPTSALFLN